MKLALEVPSMGNLAGVFSLCFKILGFIVVFEIGGGGGGDDDDAHDHTKCVGYNFFNLMTICDYIQR